jgi:arylformamidase
VRKPRAPSIWASRTGERYLGYDRAELDRQYDLLVRHGDSVEVFARLGATLSARARALPGATMNVAYGGAPAMTMDLYPATQPGAPVIAFVRGGYWRHGDKADLGCIALGLVPRGCAVAVIGHSAPGELGLAAIADEVCTAMLWLRGHAGRLNGDGKRLIAAGHGSGAHLAALTPTADWTRLEEDDRARSPIAGVVALSGFFDLEPVRLSFLNMDLRLDAAAVPQLSPLRLAPALPQPTPPYLLIVGERETDEYHRHMAGYAAALERHGARVTAATLAGHHHFSLAAELADPSSLITNHVIALARTAAAGDSVPI